jgi:hypothetical protein
MERYFEMIRLGLSETLNVQGLKMPNIQGYLLSAHNFRRMICRAEKNVGVAKSEYKQSAVTTAGADAFTIPHTRGYMIFLIKPLRATWAEAWNMRLIHEILHVFELELHMDPGTLTRLFHGVDKQAWIRPEQASDIFRQKASKLNLKANR